MISIIVAMAEDNVIGIENRLPWNLPEDMKWFRRHTLGKAVLMGRSTYESIGRPLPDRRNLVLTRDADYQAPGCTMVHSDEEALAVAGDGELMVMGGESVYRQWLPRAQRLYLTEVHARIAGDAWFPPLDRREWREIERHEHAADERHAYAYSFVILERIRAVA
ncbi:MAG: type 3 dihydrofolate reductase [Thiohalomonadaceae bacterium]